MDRKELRGTLIKAPEFRTYGASFEVRELEEKDGFVQLTGYASMTEREYEMFDMLGMYHEMVARDAFQKTLSEKPDVAFLANHEGLTMARTTNGTLELSEDQVGLKHVATLDRRRSDVNDLYLAIERGDIDQMSFAFRVVRQEWDEDYMHRKILEVNLQRGDVSAVNYGANPNTVIGARAWPSARNAQLDQLARQLESGEELSPEMRRTMARIVRSLPASKDKDAALLSDYGDELAGYNLALALRDMLKDD